MKALGVFAVVATFATSATAGEDQKTPFEVAIDSRKAAADCMVGYATRNAALSSGGELQDAAVFECQGDIDAYAFYLGRSLLDDVKPGSGDGQLVERRVAEAKADLTGYLRRLAAHAAISARGKARK